MRVLKKVVLVGAVLCASLSVTHAQTNRPYIGFVYPAGGQRGTTFQIRLGGQELDEVTGVVVSGAGVTAKITENYRRLNMEEMMLVNEQLGELKRQTMSEAAKAALEAAEKTNATPYDMAMMTQPTVSETPASTPAEEKTRQLIDRIERRTLEYVLNPASDALASVVLVEVTASGDAEPGEREIRLVTLRGISNPLSFYVGTLPEKAKKPMVTALKQVLGKEGDALRKRTEEEEETIALPCTVNGQIGSGEVNHYRFEAKRGQRLVISTLGRTLVPFIADAVPGWFEPIVELYGPDGKEVSYSDSYHFNQDPTLLYEVAQDGEYVFTIRDSLYRGREDFIYRVSIGELPFITSIFPLGGQESSKVSNESALGKLTAVTENKHRTNSDEIYSVSASEATHESVLPKMEIRGWNLDDGELVASSGAANPGIHSLAIKRKELVSNPVPIELGTLPEIAEQEPNRTIKNAQQVSVPIIINGRIAQPDDQDVFQFAGKANQTVVAEVIARQLDSPLDSVLRITDSTGKVVAFNDDYERLDAGINTHLADSYLMVRLPADGNYYVHISDVARQGGEAYVYRLRISEPRPDFELWVTPSSVSLSPNSSEHLTVYAHRKDGFSGPIKLQLGTAPNGISANEVTMSPTQVVAQLTVEAGKPTFGLCTLSVNGSAQIGGQELTHTAVPAEDKMQAFLWRHLVRASDLAVNVFDPNYQPPPKRTLKTAPAISLSATNAVADASKPRFAKEQVAGRLRELKLLFEEGMFTDEFYATKVAECEAGSF